MKELKLWLCSVAIGSVGSTLLFRVGDVIPIQSRVLFVIGLACILAAGGIMGYGIGTANAEFKARLERLNKHPS